MVEFDKPLIKERLWLMTCVLCNHTFYVPIEGKVKISERIRNFFHLKPKIQHICPACNIGRAKTTRIVTRKKLVDK